MNEFIGLMKNNFLKIKKRKALRVCAIILAVAAALSVAAYYVLGYLFGTIGSIETGFVPNRESLGTIMPFASLFLGSLSVTGTLGVIILISVVLVTCQDNSSGIIRNKISAGHKRSMIFFTSFLTNVFVMFAMFIGYSIIVAVALIIGFGWGTYSADAFVLYLFGEIFIHIAAVAFYTLIAVNAKSTPIALVITLLTITIGDALVTGFSLAASVNNITGLQKLLSITCFAQEDAIASYGNSIMGMLNGMSEINSLESFAAYTFPSTVGFGGLCYLGGSLLFSYRDIK